jgi:hypothetical protein
MTMKAQIALFLIHFNNLKKEVSNAPKKLFWLAKEREDIQYLCYELQSSYKTIEKFLRTKGSKHTLIDVHFEKEFKEYERNYKKHISNAAEPAEARNWKVIHDDLLQGEEIWLKSGKTKEEYWEYMEKTIGKLKSPEMNFDPFDPSEDDPSSLIEGILDDANLLDLIMRDDEEWNERYKKAWGAWRFFTDRFCLNFSEINKKWLNAPEMFIQTHVSQSEETPIVRLYNEAVRAYTLGCNNASVTMCRSLMEHILKNHYRVKGNNLEERINNAPQLFKQLFPLKLKLHNIRKKGNEVLHYYESGTNIKDGEVIECLFTIKILVQKVPK